MVIVDARTQRPAKTSNPNDHVHIRRRDERR